MDDLIVFLRARLDDRERAARAAQPAPWRNDEGTVRDARGVDVVDWTSSAEHLVLNDPDAVLADVAAKRGIIDRYEHYRAHVADYASVATYAHVIRVLAVPYADHPDYQESWKP